MRRYIEFLGWRSRLAIADFSREIRDREVHLAVTTPYEQATTFARFVDRLSPWRTGYGYDRRSLRRFLYRLRFPSTTLRFGWYTLAQAIANRLVPPMGLGRYEAMYPSKAMKVEWLDTHSEYANEVTGDSDTYLWAALFRLINVPWSLRPETWLITVSSHGFVAGTEGNDAVDEFTDISKTYDAWADEPELNLEGEPAFDTVFGARPYDYRTIDPRDGGRLDR